MKRPDYERHISVGFALLLGVICSEVLLLLGVTPWFAVLLGFVWCALTFIDREIET